MRRGSVSASSWRSSTLQPHAAPISSVGSSWARISPQPGELAGRETIVGGEQHLPVRPDRVGFDPAATMTLASHALADLGDHLVGQPHQMPVVYGDAGVRQRGPDPAGIRRERIDHDQLDTGVKCR